VENHAIIEIERPRSAWQLLGATFTLFRRFPWLFLVLAAVVVIPFDVVELLAGPHGPLHGPVRAVLGVIVFIADFSLVLPLISALHVHAIDDVRQGRIPEVSSVARRGLATLPVVFAAAGLSWLGIMAGLVALIVPGVLLFLRWSVVAQAAALRGKGWREALAWSRSLTGGDLYPHVFAVYLLVVLVTGIPGLLVNIAVGFHPTVASFLVDCAIGIPVSSFTALAIGLLYFDLSARHQAEGSRPLVQPGPSTGTTLAGNLGGPGDPLTPDGYTDEDRPRGWYIDPSSPKRMRYWGAGDIAEWSKRTAKTPGQTLVEWEKLSDAREAEGA
jgi:hypothetical protein